MKNNALVLYAKAPKKGNVKTRLTEGKNSMTPSQASKLYYSILFDLIMQFSKASFYSDYDFFVCPKGDIQEFRKLFKANYYILEDKGSGDLGISMSNSFKNLLDAGYKNAIIIGSDIPFLTEQLIEQAFKYFNLSYDLIIGADQSGGCYLIGANKAYAIFDNIIWSQGRDFQILIERALKKKIKLKLLQEELDIDTMQDFNKAYERLKLEKDALQDKLLKTYKFFEMFHVKRYKE